MVDCFKAHLLLSFAVSRCLQSARICWCCFPSALNLPSIGFCSMRSKNLASVCEKETLIPPSTPIKVCSTPLSARSSSIRHHLSFKNTRLGGSKRRIGVGNSEASEKGAASARELAHCSIDDPESDFVSRQSTEASVCNGSPSSELDAWCCYLLLSADSSKTYVGVTCNMQRRLKQHNGELSGGAKAARAGRPWHLVCTVHGFGTRSEGYVLEILNFTETYECSYLSNRVNCLV